MSTGRTESDFDLFEEQFGFVPGLGSGPAGDDADGGPGAGNGAGSPEEAGPAGQPGLPNGAPMPIGAGDGSVTRRRRKRRSRNRDRNRGSALRRLLIGMLTAVALLAMTGGLGVYWLYNRLPAKVERIDGVFAGLPEQARPTKEPAVATAVTFLLVGSDSRDGEGTTGTDAGGQTEPGGQRSDSMMLFHLSADRSNASLVSLPRDSWVPIPGKGTMKLNAAYSLGGPSLLVQTVEGLTGVRIDHYAVIDFAGFKTIVDNIGGVDVRVAAATKGGATTFTAGLNHLDGNAALDYVRQRHGLPEGDFDRVRRQQNLLRAVMTRVAEMDPFHHPVVMVDLIGAATKVISVDSGLTDSALRSLGMSMSGLRGGAVGFMTAPVSGTGREGSQSVVYLDKGGCTQLWTAIRNDAVAPYLQSHPAQLLSAVPR